MLRLATSQTSMPSAQKPHESDARPPNCLSPKHETQLQELIVQLLVLNAQQGAGLVDDALDAWELTLRLLSA